MGLFKRNRVWWMNFTYQGKQYQESTKTTNRKLAEAILGNVRRKIVEGHFFDTLEEKERTFTEMMERYQEEHVVKKASQGSCKSYIKNLFPFFGHYSLAEITPKLIVKYKAKRYADGVIGPTINRELALMKHAFSLAIKEWEWCRENPVSKVSMEKENTARVRYLTDEELNRVIERCPEWLKPIVIVASYTGLRRENIVTLRWNQVDLFRKVISLEHTKNGDRLSVPLCERLVELFKSLGKVRHLSGYVYARPNGLSYTGHAAGKAFDRACKKAGIEDFHFHDLRHTFASMLVQRGVDLYRVQRLLGHKTARMTQRYAHLSPDNLREAVTVLDQGFDKIMTIAKAPQETNGRTF